MLQMYFCICSYIDNKLHDKDCGHWPKCTFWTSHPRFSPPFTVLINSTPLGKRSTRLCVDCDCGVCSYIHKIVTGVEEALVHSQLSNYFRSVQWGWGLLCAGYSSSSTWFLNLDKPYVHRTRFLHRSIVILEQLCARCHISSEAKQ